MSYNFNKRPEYDSIDKLSIDHSNDADLCAEEIVDMFVNFTAACGFDRSAIIGAMKDLVEDETHIKADDDWDEPFEDWTQPIQ
jgi:hypothetical protein